MTSILKVTEIQDPTNSNSALSIDSTGRITTPARPAFRAGLTANYSHGSGGVDMSANGTWGVLFDIGGNFSTSTGLFTAPVDGIYMFTGVWGTNSMTNTMTYASWEFTINGTRTNTFWHGHDLDGSASYHGHANTGVYQLSANDTVGIFSEISQSVTINGNAGMTYSNFCGFLVG